MTPSPVLIAGIICAAALSGCDRDQDRPQTPEPRASAPDVRPPAPSAETALSQPMPGAKPDASALLQPASNSQVNGTVNFMNTPDGVRVVAEIHGLTPGKHGFHIHQNGDCSAPDAQSAGDHFNPDGKQHGGPDAEMRHRGDLGNLEADSGGHAKLLKTVRGIALDGPDSIMGKAVLVHAGEDDLKTPPSGNSGARIACGVIGVS